MQYYIPINLSHLNVVFYKKLENRHFCHETIIILETCKEDEKMRCLFNSLFAEHSLAVLPEKAKTSGAELKLQESGPR